MIPEAKLRQMILDHWGDDADAVTTGTAIEFTKAVLAEDERIRKVQLAWEFCSSRGHDIRFRDDEVFGEVVHEGGSTRIRGWKGSGKCEGCGAVLALRYQEELG